MKKNRRRETTLLFLRKEGEFFKREREFSYALRLLFALQRERERKRKTKKTRFTPAKSVLCFVVLPRFLPLDFFEYLFLKREEEEQSLGEERNSST